jgi:hypothetical protein
VEEALKLFNSMEDDELGYAEGEILGFSYFVKGKINLEDNSLEVPYIRIGNQIYDSTPKIKAG